MTDCLLIIDIFSSRKCLNPESLMRGDRCYSGIFDRDLLKHILMVISQGRKFILFCTGFTYFYEE